MRDQLTPRVVGVFELIIFPLQNHTMNTSDIVYVFTHVFKDDITYNDRSDEVFVNCTFDIFKYPVNLREMFYKYYPNLYYAYFRSSKNYYDLKKFATDIIKDSESKYTPLDVIKQHCLTFDVFFDYYTNDGVMTYIMNSNDDGVKKYIIMHYFDVNVGKLPDTPNETFVREYIRLNEDNNEELLRLCDAYGLFERIAESAPSFVGYWFEQMILRETINEDNFDEFWKEYGDRAKSRQTLGFTWIKTYHEEPPFEIYASPNVNINGDTNASLWKKYVNEYTVPKEMMDIKRYEYMIKAHEMKGDPNSTIMYTFFSNSYSNRIIFCKGDVVLDYPAVKRYVIPISYDKIKPFLCEELEINNICMFASLDKDDWSKIAGGNSDFDVVCFSDSRRFQEGPPLKRVIEYIIMHIELTFGEECEEI